MEIPQHDLTSSLSRSLQCKHLMINESIPFLNGSVVSLNTLQSCFCKCKDLRSRFICRSFKNNSKNSCKVHVIVSAGLTPPAVWCDWCGASHHTAALQTRLLTSSKKKFVSLSNVTVWGPIKIICTIKYLLNYKLRDINDGKSHLAAG